MVSSAIKGKVRQSKWTDSKMITKVICVLLRSLLGITEHQLYAMLCAKNPFPVMHFQFNDGDRECIKSAKT